MKFLRTLTVVVFLLFSAQTKADDSLTLAQAYINLSITEEYFDSLAVQRICKILPFIEKELATLKNDTFIKQNNTLYNFTYSLLFYNKAKFLFKTTGNGNRYQLIQWKNNLDSAIYFFNLSEIDSYYTVDKEKNPFYEFVKFDGIACYNLYNNIQRLQNQFAPFFNRDIYPDFIRILHQAKKTNRYHFDSLAYYTRLYGMPISFDILQDTSNKGNKAIWLSRASLTINQGYRLATGLDLISKFLQFNYVAKVKPANETRAFNLNRLYESWDVFIYELKPSDPGNFAYNDMMIPKDKFFMTEMNATTCDRIYKLLQQKYPYKYTARAPSYPIESADQFSKDPTKYYFPVPVPFPSTFYYVANYQPGLKTLQQVDNYLSGIFNQAGYAGNLHYYYVKDGFAMTTSLEKINKDGSPVSGSTRWSVSVAGNKAFSFYEVFKSIFFETKSDFRMFALVVSPRGAGIQSNPSSIGAMQELIRYSYPSLPNDLKNETLPYKTLSAFAYIFSQSDIGEVPMLDVSRRLSLQTHLQKSGLGNIISNR